MRQIKFRELMTELFNKTVNNKPSSFKNIYLKDGDGGFHTVQDVDLMDSRFRCEDGYFDEYEWIRKDDTRLYVD